MSFQAILLYKDRVTGEIVAEHEESTTSGVGKTCAEALTHLVEELQNDGVVETIDEEL